MSEYSALENFLAAYFHQDWQDEHATPEEVVRYFVENESADEVSAVRGDLARLAALNLDDAALGAKFAELGCEYYPNDSTWTVFFQTLRKGFAPDNTVSYSG